MHAAEDFLAKIRDDDSDAARNAYSDWLEENGDVGQAVFVRRGVAFPGTLTFRVRAYNGPGLHRIAHRSGAVYDDPDHKPECRWSPFRFVGFNTVPRGTVGFVRRLLPPAPTQPGFWEARFHRGLLCALTVPNAWWLTHGDQVCGLTSRVDVTTPDDIVTDGNETEVWIVGDPLHRLAKWTDLGSGTSFPGWRWPTARFDVNPGCVPQPATAPPGDDPDPFDVTDAP